MTTTMNTIPSTTSQSTRKLEAKEDEEMEHPVATAELLEPSTSQVRSCLPRLHRRPQRQQRRNVRLVHHRLHLLLQSGHLHQHR